MAWRRRKAEATEAAQRRVGRLLDRAEAEATGPDRDLADDWGRLSQRVAERHQLGHSARQKALVCRSCGCLQVAGRTLRVRLSRGRLVRTCLGCGHVRRRPLAPRSPTARSAAPSPSAPSRSTPRPPPARRQA